MPYPAGVPQPRVGRRCLHCGRIAQMVTRQLYCSTYCRVAAWRAFHHTPSVARAQRRIDTATKR